MRKTTRSAAGARLLALGWLLLFPGLARSAEREWSLTVGLGRAETEALFGSRHLKSIADDDQTAVLAVGRDLGRFLAVEAGYQDFGNFAGFGSPCAESTETCIERLATLGICAEGTDCTRVVIDLNAEIRGYSLAVVPKWPLSERLALRGKLGVMAWDGELRGGQGFGRIEDPSGEELLVGVGLQYDFESGVGLSLQHDRFELDLESTLFGIHWKF